MFQTRLTILLLYNAKVWVTHTFTNSGYQFYKQISLIPMPLPDFSSQLWIEGLVRLLCHGAEMVDHLLELFRNDVIIPTQYAASTANN